MTNYRNLDEADLLKILMVSAYDMATAHGAVIPTDPSTLNENGQVKLAQAARDVDLDRAITLAFCIYASGL